MHTRAKVDTWSLNQPSLWRLCFLRSAIEVRPLSLPTESTGRIAPDSSCFHGITTELSSCKRMKVSATQRLQSPPDLRVFWPYFGRDLEGEMPTTSQETERCGKTWWWGHGGSQLFEPPRDDKRNIPLLDFDTWYCFVRVCTSCWNH